jgi:hypothetical protein
MTIAATIIDHHKIPVTNFIRFPQVQIVMGYDQENYFENVKQYVNQPYDIVFSDENPDAMFAAAIYLLSRQQPPLYICISRELKAPDCEKIANAGKQTCVIFNTLNSYFCDVDMLSPITLINPHESGLSNISASQIMYKGIECPTPFMRDLAAIAIVMDYTMDESFETIVEVVGAYPETFADVRERIKTITLNKYNVHQSAFGELTALYRAPSILYGVKGVEELIQKLLNNLPYTIVELLGNVPNETISYLQQCASEYKSILAEEHKRFESEKQLKGNVIIYAPHYQSENFVREFANIIKDTHIDSIVVMKAPTRNNQYKYSIRRGELNIDLGAILEEMDVGGGNPFSAGCTVSDPDEFERGFLKKVKSVLM